MLFPPVALLKNRKVPPVMESVAAPIGFCVSETVVSPVNCGKWRSREPPPVEFTDEPSGKSVAPPVTASNPFPDKVSARA